MLILIIKLINTHHPLHTLIIPLMLFTTLPTWWWVWTLRCVIFQIRRDPINQILDGCVWVIKTSTQRSFYLQKKKIILKIAWHLKEYCFVALNHLILTFNRYTVVFLFKNYSSNDIYIVFSSEVNNSCIYNTLGTPLLNSYAFLTKAILNNNYESK